jgi:hypothetical protein
MIRINHFTDFYNLINSVGLSSTSPYDNFTRTVDRFVSLCGCDQATKKAEAGDDSKKLYMSLARSEIGSQIQMIKKKRNVSKIEFYSDNSLLSKY